MLYKNTEKYNVEFGNEPTIIVSTRRMGLGYALSWDDPFYGFHISNEVKPTSAFSQIFCKDCLSKKGFQAAL